MCAKFVDIIPPQGNECFSDMKHVILCEPIVFTYHGSTVITLEVRIIIDFLCFQTTTVDLYTMHREEMY